MPLSTLIVLSFVATMFGAFMVGLGGGQLWLVLGDRRDRRAARVQALAQAARREPVEAEWRKAA